MVQAVFDNASLWAVFFFSVLLFLASCEIGFRIGRSQQRRRDKIESVSTGIVTGSILGLVSFLLAFSFGIAASNFSERRGAVLDEANVIGTAYLRADLLPAAQREEMRSLLRAYTEVRVKVTEPGVGLAGYFQAIHASEEIHRALWPLVAGVAAAEPTPTHALVVSSVNDVIDMHSVRLAVGVRYAIPSTIWIALYLVSGLALAATGYRFGVSFGTRSELLPAMVISFACVVSLISDLDNPAHGFLLNDHTPMRDLLVMMDSTEP